MVAGDDEDGVLETGNLGVVGEELAQAVIVISKTMAKSKERCLFFVDFIKITFRLSYAETHCIQAVGEAF